MPPLPSYAFMARCLVKHRDNFTLPNLRCRSDCAAPPSSYQSAVTSALRCEHARYASKGMCSDKATHRSIVINSLPHPT